MQVDNRQRNHEWGPWMWVATGTYAEPIQSDEQPESWRAFTPDLHTARLTANRMRQMNYDYRYAKLCPMATAPGFFSHQTDMLNATRQRAWDTPRFARDFDFFGYQYALLSSVGSAGLHTVVNMLPARDAAEYALFPQADLAFIKRWLRWADENIELLRTAAPLPVPPAAGATPARTPGSATPARPTAALKRPRDLPPPAPPTKAPRPIARALSHRQATIEMRTMRGFGFGAR